jgi:hypothetical protein
MQKLKRIVIPREILLVEIDRRCFFADCNTRVLIGLTKQEAFRYGGFECLSCSRWNEDSLSEKDIPDWWDEISWQSSQH